MSKLHPPVAQALSALLLALSATAYGAEPQSQAQPTVEERLTALEQQSAKPAALPDSVQVRGLVEVEAVGGEDYAGQSYSDLTVATVEVGVDAAINDKVSAALVFLYEQDQTDFGVDEATLTIAGLVGPVNFTVGKMYVPFGTFETALINDTLVLELAETNKTAALFAFAQSGIEAGAYVFDGDQERERHAENYGVTVGFVQETFQVGVDYLSSITESDGVADLNETLSAEADPVIDPAFEWDDAAPAYNVHGQIALGAVVLIAEYIGLADPLVDATNGIEIEPAAAQLELDFTATLAGHEYTLAAGYQQTEDALVLGLPEERMSLGCSTEIYRNVTLGGEIWRDTDYGLADGGSDEESDNLVVQLAASF